MKRAAWPIVLACGSLLPIGCVRLNINEERFHAPNVVQGFPRDRGQLEARNEALLRKAFPNRRDGKDIDAASEVPHSGRLWDPDVSPSRTPAPGEDDDRRRFRFASEWEFNRFYGKEAPKGKDDPPRLCLAMSGGGIRSASFNIGVLSALYQHKQNDRRILDRVDVLSAVSGGTYALAWYYAQHHIDATRPYPIGAVKLEEGLFAEGGLYQRHLQKNGMIFNRPSYYAIGAANLAVTPLNLFANGIFGWHMNTNPGRDLYEWRLQEVFQQPPPDREGEPLAELARVPAIHFEDLRRTMKDRRLPYFVINTTSFLEDSSDHFGAPLYNSIYEFTPISFGSDALGRYNYDPKRPQWPVTFARAVSISGAALDGTKLIPGSSQRTLWSVFNQDLGYHMDNPAISEERRIAHLFMPFPLYYSHHYPRDLHGTNIYLSDGGHSENLGAYALVRRLCEKIIVVDAEHDPSYEFEAYYALKRALRRDMGVDLQVPGIERIAQHEQSLRTLRVDAFLRDPVPVPPVAPEGAAVLPLPSTSPPDGRAGQGYPPFATSDLLASKGWNDAAASRTMRGCVAYLPYPGRAAILSVTYLKLAYTQTEAQCEPVDEYRRLQCPENHWRSWENCMFHLENEDRRNACQLGDKDRGSADDPGCKSLWHALDSRLLTKDEAGRFSIDHSRIYFCRKRETAELRASPYTRFVHFPQEPTTDQDFDQWQFKAYRHLGFQTAMQAMEMFHVEAQPECPETGLN